MAQWIPAGRGPAGWEGVGRVRRSRECGESTYICDGREVATNGGAAAIPTGAESVGGSLRASGGGGAFEGATHSGSFLGDTRVEVTCGVCAVTLQRGHRAVYLCHVETDAAWYTHVLWRTSLRAARHQRYPVAQQPVAESGTRDGIH